MVEFSSSEAARFIKENIQTWSSLQLEEMQFNKTIGNSNKVYVVSNSAGLTPAKIIFRIFGPNDVTDKPRENKIFNKLAELDIGPKMLGQEAGLRLEEYWDGFDPIPRKWLFDPNVNKKIADLLRTYHSQDMSDTLNESTLICIEHPRKWRALAQARLAENPNITNRKQELAEVMELLSDENWRLYLSILPSTARTVFIHGDPSELNFLYNARLDEVRFVDFEFAGFGYAACDLAYIINEAQYEYDYPEYPYWSFVPEDLPTYQQIADFITFYGGGKELFIQVQQMMIASHYHWAMWSLAMYKGDRDGYDYLGYALLRYREFKTKYSRYITEGGQAGLVSRAEVYFGDKSS